MGRLKPPTRDFLWKIRENVGMMGKSGKIYGEIWEHVGKTWKLVGKYGRISETMGRYGI
jgi:hypothetical protein